MKNRYILILLLLISCAQHLAEKKKSTSFSEEFLFQKILKELHLIESKVSFISKENPNNLKETIIVIPESENLGENDTRESFSSHILIVDNITGKIKNRFFENSKSNGWVSDAIFIDDIRIDTADYQLSKKENAFGVIVKFRSSSQSNPYNQEILSLYTKEKNNLKKVLDSYITYEDFGEVNVNVNTCFTKINKTVNKLTMSDSLTNGYFDLLIERENFEINSYIDKKGECNLKERMISVNKPLLKFNSITYQKEIYYSFKQLEILTKSKAIKKYGGPSFSNQFILDDTQGEFRNGISNVYSREERQRKSILIEEITWEKDKNTWITVWYEVGQKESIPKEVYIWEKGTEF